MVKNRPNVAARRSIEAGVPAKVGVPAKDGGAAKVDPKPMQGRSRAELSREVRFALDAFAGQGTSTLRRPRMTEGRNVPFICG